MYCYAASSTDITVKKRNSQQQTDDRLSIFDLL